MSSKRYINQIQFNPENSSDIKKDVSNYFNKKDFHEINANGETFFANNTINQFRWVICLKISFNDNTAFIEAWLFGVNIIGKTNFNEEYGPDSMFGYMWRPISALKAVIRDVEIILTKEA